MFPRKFRLNEASCRGVGAAFPRPADRGLRFGVFGFGAFAVFDCEDAVGWDRELVRQVHQGGGRSGKVEGGGGAPCSSAEDEDERWETHADLPGG